MEDANIRTAMEAEKEFVKDPMCITAYEQHMKYVRDKRARENFVRNEGFKEGEAIGEERGEARGKAIGLAKAAHVLKKLGKSESEIAELLDLDIAKVYELLAMPCGN